MQRDIDVFQHVQGLTEKSRGAVNPTLLRIQRPLLSYLDFPAAWDPAPKVDAIVGSEKVASQMPLWICGVKKKIVWVCEP